MGKFRLIRSWFLAPAGNETKLVEGLASNADAFVLDLSQAQAVNAEEARRAAANFLRQNHSSPMVFYIMTHASGSDLLQGDLEALVPFEPAGIVLPHADGGSDLQQLDVMISVQEALAGLPVGRTKIVALTGDHAGVAFSAGSYRAKSQRLEALGWWADRAAGNIGVNRLHESNGRLAAPLEAVRTLTLLGASTAGVGAIDTPSAAMDIEHFRVECDSARGDGFAGKIAISAEQAAVINTVFAA
ncbi:citrate lyase subunit beta/citryl-CoA lyase [Rhizobium sp. BK376]|nr:citrate lyase subunit beta/citryl-CoA lyase [Rhizobium sp. BK376]